MSVDERIIRLVGSYPGIRQAEIVTNLKQSGHSKTPVINCLKKLVEEKKLQSRKRGKAVEYTTMYSETYDEVTKNMTYQLGEIEKIISEIKNGKYSFGKQQEIINYLAQLEPSMHGMLKSDQTPEDMDRFTLKEEEEEMHEMLDKLNNKEMVYKINKVMDKLAHDIVVASKNKESYIHKLRKTKSVRKRKKIQSNINEKESNISNRMSVLVKMRLKLQCKYNNMDGFVNDLYDEYVEEKPTTITKIDQILNERKSSMHKNNLMMSLQELWGSLFHYDRNIAELDKLEYDEEDEDELAFIRIRRDHKKSRYKNLSKCNDDVLEMLENKIPLPKINNMICECLNMDSHATG